MTSFDKAWDATGRAEGGYVNDPADSGGTTNHGITERTARAHGYSGHMQDLSASFARSIAKTAYWDVLSLDKVSMVSYQVAAELFDTGFLTGPEHAARMLQRALNALNDQQAHYPDVVADGHLGDKTVTALESYLVLRKREGNEVLMAILNGLLVEHFTELVERRAKDERFYYGWVLNRVVLS